MKATTLILIVAVALGLWYFFNYMNAKKRANAPLGIAGTPTGVLKPVLPADTSTGATLGSVPFVKPTYSTDSKGDYVDPQQPLTVFGTKPATSVNSFWP